MSRFAPLAIFIALSGLFYVALFRGDRGEIPSPLINHPLPVFALPTLENPETTVTNESLVGQVALLNVWASWCPACYDEHPYLLKLAQKGVLIFGMNYKDKLAEATAWLSKMHSPFHFNISDESGKLGLDLGVYGAPETFFLDHHGVIRYKHIGVITPEIWRDELAPIYDQLKAEQVKAAAKAGVAI